MRPTREASATLRHPISSGVELYDPATGTFTASSRASWRAISCEQATPQAVSRDDPEYYDAFNNRNVSGNIALFNAGEVLFARLAIGLGVCAALCGMYVFFEGTLNRRRAYWKLFYSTATNALSRE